MSNYLDNRLSLWDLNMKQPHIGSYDYTLLNEPYRGGSCLVYPVLRHETVGNKTYERRVFLKEFYPILEIDERNGMYRNPDGSIYVAETVKNSSGYQKGLTDFHESYIRMLELSKFEQSAELLVVPLLIVEDNGTWYREEAYDAGTSFSRLFRDKECGFSEFLQAMGKCYQAIAGLHQVGYYHLDVKPQNIAYTYRKGIKLFDADSFVKKNHLKGVRIQYWSEGYSAPEIIAAASTPEDTQYLIGPWTDVYSLAQIICWYLFGRPININETDWLLEELYVRVIERSNVGIYDGGRVGLDMELDDEVSVSLEGIDYLASFLLRSLTPHRRRRYQSVEDAYEDFRMVASYF